MRDTKTKLKWLSSLDQQGRLSSDLYRHMQTCAHAPMWTIPLYTHTHTSTSYQRRKKWHILEVVNSVFKANDVLGPCCRTVANSGGKWSRKYRRGYKCLCCGVYALKNEADYKWETGNNWRKKKNFPDKGGCETPNLEVPWQFLGNKMQGCLK